MSITCAGCSEEITEKILSYQPNQKNDGFDFFHQINPWHERKCHQKYEERTGVKPCPTIMNAGMLLEKLGMDIRTDNERIDDMFRGAGIEFNTDLKYAVLKRGEGVRGSKKGTYHVPVDNMREIILNPYEKWPLQSLYDYFITADKEICLLKCTKRHLFVLKDTEEGKQYVRVTGEERKEGIADLERMLDIAETLIAININRE